MSSYDVIVIGLGAMGSATAYQLARRGQRVLGLERFTPAHANGSSHGRSRIIRQAYFEGAAYVPLLQRAYELWEKLERESGNALLTITGGLMLGKPDTEVVQGSIRSAQQYNLPHEVLDSSEIRRRFPMLQIDDDAVALYEEKAGVLIPELCITSQLDLATKYGAELHFEEPVLSWEADPSGEGVRVTTANGSYTAARAVITAGAWNPELLADLGLPLSVERQVIYWFEPIGDETPYTVGHFPIFIWDIDEHDQLYGFPIQERGTGVKVGFFYRGRPSDPNQLDREIHEDEIAEIQAALQRYMPSAAGPLLSAVSCMYTMTPDEHFIIAPHPHAPQVTIASPCSGHGFKFSSVIGEILADLAINGTTEHPIAMFDPARFQRK